MGYVRRERLGSTAGTALVAAGANLLVPGSGTAIGIISSLSSLFGGSATDAARLKRVQWTLDMAKQRSRTAVAIILAAPLNTSGNEHAMWTAVLPAVPADLLAAVRAETPNGWWPSGQPDFFTDVGGPTHTTIVAEARAAGGTGFATVSTTAAPAGGSSLPGMTTTAPFNYTPWLIGGAALVGVFALSRRRR
jgi:hypothetical protein